jgi:DNA-binding transcriptional LysR family regulator
VRWNLQQLRFFVAAAKFENFHRAAEDLGVAQPAISKQIRELESSLGVELFARLPRGVKLTDTGRAVAEDVRNILDQLDGVRLRAHEVQQGIRGRLRIGMNEAGVGCTITSHIIRRFKAEFPMITFDVLPMHSQRQVEALDHREIDIGFLLSSYINPSRYDWIECSPIHLAIAVYRGHPLAEKQAISVNDLDHETIIWTVHNPSEIGHLKRMIGIKATAHRISPSPEITLQLVASEFGIAPVNSPASRAHPDVVFRPVKEPLRNEFTCLAWLNDEMSEPLKNFAALARATKAEFAEKQARQTA